MIKSKPFPDDVPDPGQDGLLLANQTMQNVLTMMLAARKAYGASRLLVASKACEFLRMILGGDDTDGRGGARRAARMLRDHPDLLLVGGRHGVPARKRPTYQNQDLRRCRQRETDP